MLWSEMDSETARQADEAEAVLNRLIGKEFGGDAYLRRDPRFGEYRLFWKRPELGKACETGRSETELFLFTPEHTTAQDMLWNSHFGFNEASTLEKDRLSDTPLSLAFANVSKGILDYLWDKAHPNE